MPEQHDGEEFFALLAIHYAMQRDVEMVLDVARTAKEFGYPINGRIIRRAWRKLTEEEETPEVPAAFDVCEFPDDWLDAA